MPHKVAFDNDQYLKEQSEAILQRINESGEKLYLEFGGKLLFDYHASRVLPGFDPNVKMRLLQKLRDQTEIILCIYAGDIERKKLRADFGITYDVDALKLIDDIREWGLDVRAVVITRYENQPSVNVFKNKLERQNVDVYTHTHIQGYPNDVDRVVSDRGYGANAFIETDKPLVLVTAPGPGSGKLATCLTLLYHEHQRGQSAGYAKFETFPIWNLPLKHPVNVAYEAATADLGDVNQVDPFHLEAYDERAINYNRDVEAFPVLKRILQRITDIQCPYESPTDMGVNRAGFAITDDEAVREAAKQEVVRRYFRYRCEYAMGFTEKDTVQRTEVLMEELDIGPESRCVVEPARQAADEAEQQGKGHDGIHCGAAIELPNGDIVTGKNSPLLHSTSALVLNAIKQLAGLPDDIHLLSPNIIESVTRLKDDILDSGTLNLDLEETLIALSISAATNPAAKECMEELNTLQNCELHLSHIPTSGDEAGLRRLGVNLTSDAQFATKQLFQG